MNGKKALSCRTGGARQSGERKQAPMAVANSPWVCASFTPVPTANNTLVATIPPVDNHHVLAAMPNR